MSIRHVRRLVEITSVYTLAKALEASLIVVVGMTSNLRGPDIAEANGHLSRAREISAWANALKNRAAEELVQRGGDRDVH